MKEKNNNFNEESRRLETIDKTEKSLTAKIEHTQTLIESKKRLEKELKDINAQLEEEQKRCNHINVCLGWDGPYQCRNTSICTCLLCGENDPESEHKVIEAAYYKANLYSHGELAIYREKRLHELQKLATNLMNEDSHLTESELAEKIDEKVSADIKISK